MLVWWRWPEVWGLVWEVVVWKLVRMIICMVEEMMARVVEGLDGGFFIGSTEFTESSGKTFQIVFLLFQFLMRCVLGQPGKEKW